MKSAALALALLLASCTPKSTRPRVRIGAFGTGLQMWAMPVTLADRLGYFREEGLDVDLENLSGGPKAAQALLGGSVDAACYYYEHNILLAAEGQHVRSFFITTKTDGKVLIVSPSAQDRIKRLSDLKGALIGVSSPGSTTQTWLEYSLAANRLPKSEFRTVGIGLGAPVFAAIESGRVDASVMAGGDHLALKRRHPDLRVLLDSSTAEGMRATYGAETFAGGTLSARQEWLDRNPDLALRLARALHRTMQWIATHTPEEIREKLPDGFRSQDASLDCAIIDWGKASYTADGRMPPGAPEVMKRYLSATVEKVRDSKFDLGATWTDEYLTGPK